jgi:hypothetical protein
LGLDDGRQVAGAVDGIVPGLEHVALTFNPRTYTGQQTQSIEAAAPHCASE